MHSDTETNVVAVFTDHAIDKYALFENTLRASKFYSVLERDWKQSGKSKDNFFIAVKPNISMMLRRDDVGTYTDTFLVIHLLRRLIQRGYQNIAVVESQNLYGNWFENRSVVQVAARAGYFDESVIETYQGEKSHCIHVKGEGVDHQVPLIDLTLDKVPHQFGHETLMLGKTWIDADFRLNISALKAHFYGHYTIAIKNIYGCLPEQDKVVAYHCKRKVGEWTARLIHEFPVHFSIAAGYSSADGWFGVKMKAISRKTHTFIAGEDILAVDHVGASLMGVTPEKSIMYTSLLKYRTFRPYQVAGAVAPFQKWRKVPTILVKACIWIESSADAMDYGGFIATGGNDSCFPLKENYGGSCGHTVGPGNIPGRMASVKGFFKWLSYYLSIPLAFCLDFGIVRLNLRKWNYKKKMILRQKKFPIISNSAFLMSRFLYLGPEELSAFSKILDQDIPGKFSFSGHMIINGTNEISFPCRLFTSNIAVVEMLNYMHENNLSVVNLKNEIQILLDQYRKMFGKETRYAYCFR